MQLKGLVDSPRKRFGTRPPHTHTHINKASPPSQCVTGSEILTECPAHFFLPSKKAGMRKQNYQNQPTKPTKCPTIMRDLAREKQKGK